MITGESAFVRLRLTCMGFAGYINQGYRRYPTCVRVSAIHGTPE